MSEDNPFGGLDNVSERTRKKVRAQQAASTRSLAAFLVGGFVAFVAGVIAMVSIVGLDGLVDCLGMMLQGLALGTVFIGGGTFSLVLRAMITVAPEQVYRAKTGLFFLLIFIIGGLVGATAGMLYGVLRHPAGGQQGLQVLLGTVIVAGSVGACVGYFLAPTRKD